VEGDMAKAKPKTVETEASVTKFIKAVPDERKRNDSLALIEIMRQITKQEPKMWGPSIVGFGKYHYKYASGHEGDCCVTGFSPRKADLTIYIMCGFTKSPELMKTLGKHKTGKACLYIKTLDDVHLPTLRKLIRESVKYISTKKWP
jgi:hypothetical protein